MNKAIAPLIKTLKTNCDISDAGGSAIFSICGMALRLRDLNKWEQKLNPWEEEKPARLIDWIDAKEQTWERVGGSEFSRLPLNGEPVDAFDTRSVNQVLNPLGLFYGAGYAHSLKPTFFLAEIREIREINNIQIMILDRELVRDLLTLPALTQDDTVILRRDAARLFLWDQMAYIKKSGQRFLRYALRQCGLPGPGVDHRIAHFDAIMAVQEQTYIYHEIGEITDRVFPGDRFREILSLFPHTPVELLARTLKDLLADTGSQGTISRMIETRSASGIGFYAAFQDGLFRPLFPGFRRAVEEFVANQDWGVIEAAKQQGFTTAARYARELMDMVDAGRDSGHLDRTADRINRELVQPLNDLAQAV